MDTEIPTKEYYRLSLVSYVGDKISLLRQIRKILDCELEQGKRFLGERDSTILHTTTEQSAEEIRDKVKEIGIHTVVTRVLLLEEPTDLYPFKTKPKNLLMQILFG